MWQWGFNWGLGKLHVGLRQFLRSRGFAAHDPQNQCGQPAGHDVQPLQLKAGDMLSCNFNAWGQPRHGVFKPRHARLVDRVLSHCLI
jgi:hypothetical protein